MVTAVDDSVRGRKKKQHTIHFHKFKLLLSLVRILNGVYTYYDIFEIVHFLVKNYVFRQRNGSIIIIEQKEHTDVGDFDIIELGQWIA